jgi:hypothetical protein
VAEGGGEAERAAAAGCIRCGGFDVSGPAADVGFRLCAACFAWEPGRPPVRYTAVDFVLPAAPLLVFLPAVMFARFADLPEGVLRAATVGAGILSIVGTAAGLVWMNWRTARWRQARIAALKLDPERLRASGGPGAIVRVVYYAKLDETAMAGAIPEEIAVFGATLRGVLVFGGSARAALPWDEAGLERVHRLWIRLSKPGGPHHVCPADRRGAVAARALEPLLSDLEALRDAGLAAAGRAGTLGGE